MSDSILDGYRSVILLQWILFFWYDHYIIPENKFSVAVNATYKSLPDSSSTFSSCRTLVMFSYVCSRVLFTLLHANYCTSVNVISFPRVRQRANYSFAWVLWSFVVHCFTWHTKAPQSTPFLCCGMFCIGIKWFIHHTSPDNISIPSCVCNSNFPSRDEAIHYPHSAHSGIFWRFDLLIVLKWNTFPYWRLCQCSGESWWYES